jgi:hypothetical protein
MSRTIPPPGVQLTRPDGLITPDWWDYLARGVGSGGDGGGAGQTEYLSGVLAAPANETLRIVEYIPYGATITQFVAKTQSGTITASLKINGTTVTGSSISVTSTQQIVAPSGLNTMVAGQVLELVLASAAGPVNMSFAIHFTRN